MPMKEAKKYLLECLPARANISIITNEIVANTKSKRGKERLNNTPKTFKSLLSKLINNNERSRTANGTTNLFGVDAKNKNVGISAKINNAIHLLLIPNLPSKSQNKMAEK